MRTSALAVLALALIGCNSGSSSSTTASSTASTTTSSSAKVAPGSNADQAVALMQTSRDWSKAALSGDVNKTLSYWSDDAIVLQPGEPAISGKQAIRNMVESSMKRPKFSISWEPERAWISGSGDVGYLIEHNRVTLADSTGAARTVYGKAVTIWKKDASGNWKCAVDTWNENPTVTVFGAGL